MPRVGRFALIVFEIALLSVAILATRCANYRDVFIAGEIYYSDADCYARMTRARMCLAHPGLIVRRHDFENFPQGTTPHTTAPLDYLIVGLAVFLGPLTAHALDLAGAVVSPLLALLGGWFLWSWARNMSFRYRWPMLIVYAVSPILVQGAELGRPDHQSLLIVLLAISLCAEWSMIARPSRNWGIVAGCAWGLALWVSFYEPLILLLLAIIASTIFQGPFRSSFFHPVRKTGWCCFFLVLGLALTIERRIPSVAIFVTEPFVRHWASNIGELRHVPLLGDTWSCWAGYFVMLLPLLFWWQYRKPISPPAKTRLPVVFVGLLGATFLLTLWQARWGYFFVTLFLLSLPALLEPLRSRGLVWTAFILSLWPVARAWDEKIWPEDARLASRAAERSERVSLRQLAANMRSSDRRPFLAPWWLSPALAYWSEQPALAGSSHESIAGIVQSAQFYATVDWQKAREILESRGLSMVIAYDADRTAENSGQILGQTVPQHAVCYVLDRAPAQSPEFLVLAAQNPAGKLFRVGNNL